MTYPSQPTPVRRTAVQLRPCATAPRQARRLVRELAGASGLPVKVIDDAAFIVGELVTSSIRELHGRALVTVELDDWHVTVRVSDDGGMPSGAELPGGARAVRHWDVVRRLATSWGYARDGAQRQLWATIRTGHRLAAA